MLNYNGVSFLGACFESLNKTLYPSVELILVDNHSSDNSVAFMQKTFPDVQILETGANNGYSRAYNLAFERAKGEYYVLLNNDVVVNPDWLDFLVESAQSDKSLAALQPKIRSLIDSGYFEYAGAAGGFIDKYGYPLLRGRIFYTIEKDEGQYDDERELFWASGAALFLRASVLKVTGNLDEDFVHHMEEIDLCWRMLLHGYKLKVIPRSVIFHHAGATIKPDSFMKLYWNHRNNIYMLLKNIERQNLLKTVFIRCILDYINILFSAIVKLNLRHSWAIIRAHAWILANLRQILRKRQQIQKSRNTTDDAVGKYVLDCSLVFQYFVKKRTTFAALPAQTLTKSEQVTHEN